MLPYVGPAIGLSDRCDGPPYSKVSNLRYFIHLPLYARGGSLVQGKEFGIRVSTLL